MAGHLGSESENSLAALLATLLADEEWWARFEQCPDDQRWRDRIADHAMTLFRRMAPVLDAIVRAGHEDHRAAHAVSAVNEIANASAMRAERWATSDDEKRQMLSREIIEGEIRLLDLHKWARSLGHPLHLRTSDDLWESVPEEFWSNWENPTIEWSHDLPAAFAMDADAYGRLVDAHDWLRTHDEPDVRTLIQGREFRIAACQQIANARNCTIWTRGHVPDGEAQVAAAAMLWVSHAYFILSRVVEHLAHQPFLSVARGLMLARCSHGLRNHPSTRRPNTQKPGLSRSFENGRTWD